MTLSDLARGCPLNPDLEDSVLESEARKMLADLLELEEGLNDWEVDFVESLSKRKEGLTDNQKIKLEEVWNRHF